MKRTIISIAAVCIAFLASAQPAMPPVPVDPGVRIGKLDNGLTYYIRHNEEPKGQANFYIAQKVGSILEEENQRGLAHFLEHMCFNGTEHFPGNGVVKYCESIGVKFGADLNAYTSIDETVYNIDNVPVEKFPTAIDSCLCILHDWADGLLLTGEDIDHERGVIHEEWRSRSNAAMRQYEYILPRIYPGNRYGERLPIGLMEVVDNFPYQAIRDYYEKWYRPDQQGIVVVGDIDVDAVEAKIKDIFGVIATPVDPAERYYVRIEDNAEPIVCMSKDKEQPYAQVMVFKKFDPVPNEAKGDMSYLIYCYMQDIATRMINSRIQELLQSPEPPFVNGAISFDDFFIATTKKALTGVAICDENKLATSAATIYREMLRAQRGGFTASEYERARATYMTNLESAYNQREKRKSATFCREYVRHFIDNEPIPGIENEYAIAQQIVPNIPVEYINQFFAGVTGADNLVVACMLPDKDGVVYPTEAELAEVFKSVEAEEIAPYEDKVSDEPLIGKLPKAGKAGKGKAALYGYTCYKLSNGATVYIKPTDFNADEIRMYAFSWGGLAYYPASESVTLKCVDDLIGIGGYGAFSSTELTKALAGKKAFVGKSINVNGETLNGRTTPKDFETMLQLAWLKFTSPREDQDAFASWKNRTAASLLNAEVQPMSAFQDTVFHRLYTDPSRIGSIKHQQVEEVDYARALQIERERFANAADFTFVFTGNIDVAAALPLISKYIGALPGKKNKHESCKDGAPFAFGDNSRFFDRSMEVPMVTNLFFDIAKIDYTPKNVAAFDIATQTLSIVLLEEIREKEGGTYGISANGNLVAFPNNVALMQIVYQTAPEKYEYLNGRVREIVAEFAEDGPTAENLDKVKKNMVKNYQEGLRENYFWQENFVSYLQTGVDEVEGYEALVESITVDDVKAVMNELLNQNNRSEIIMHGVAQ